MVLVPTFEKVMVPVPVPVPTLEKLRFRFRFQLHIYYLDQKKIWKIFCLFTVHSKLLY
jgi:hypothetical protein